MIWKTRPGDATTRREDRRPTARAAELAGDLDTIVLKALRKEPARRYGSVNELADDVRRHLEGQPVRARPDTLAYRTGKFLKRHRLATAAAALAVLSLVGGLAATARQARIAEASRARAERRFAEARKIANALLTDIPAELKKVPGTMSARALIVSRAVEYLDGLAADASGDASFQLELGAAYVRLAGLQGALFGESIGKREDAARSLEKARDLTEAAVAQAPADPTARRRLGELNRRAGTARLLDGDVAGGLSLMERARDAFDAGLRLAPDDLELRKGQAGTALECAMALALSDRMREGRDEARRGVELLERLLAAHPKDAEIREMLAVGLDRLGALEEELAPGRKAGMPAFERALAINEELVAEAPGQASFVQGVLGMHSRIGESREAAGDLRGALDAALRAQTLAERLAEADHANVAARSDLGYILLRMAALQTKTGDPGSAVATAARAHALLDPLLASDPGNAQLRYRAAELWLADGRAWAALAADRKRSGAERDAARARALGRLREAAARFSALDAEGLVVGVDRAKVQEATAERDVLESASARH